MKVKLHLYKYGTIEVAKNFLHNLNWWDLDNSESFDQYEANFPDFVGSMLHSDHNENLHKSRSILKTESILFSEYNSNNDNHNLIDNMTDIRSLNPSKVLSKWILAGW